MRLHQRASQSYKSGVVYSLSFTLISNIHAAEMREDQILDNYLKADTEASINVNGVEATAIVNADAKKEGESIRNFGGSLTLKLGSGKSIVLRDRDECASLERESNCIFYRLIVHMHTRRLFVVAEYHYENTNFLVIDARTGYISKVDEYPYISPNGDHILIASSQPRYVGCSVQILKRKGDQFLAIWLSDVCDRSAIYSSYDRVIWRNDSRVEFSCKNSYEGKSEEVSERLSLTYSGSTWKYFKTR